MKLRSSFLVAALILSVAVVSPTPANASTNVCIAYDTGGLGDRSFNDATLAGVKKAQNQMTFTFEGVVTDGTATDRVKRLRTLAAKNCAAIIAVGGEYRKAVDQLSTEAMPNEPNVITKKPLKIYSLINSSLPIQPVIRSTNKAITIIANDKKPTTDFSLISLLSLKSSLMNPIILHFN